MLQDRGMKRADDWSTLVIAGCFGMATMLAGCGNHRSDQSTTTTGNVDTTANNFATRSNEPMASMDPGDTAKIAGPILVTEPQPNTTVISPLRVTGRARGSWYFEASFPVRLVDSQGRVLDEAPASAQGEWMTESFVPFGAVLTFQPPTGTTGRLILEKHNASGLPQHADSVVIPVRF
jgi:hypothetical protein